MGVLQGKNFYFVIFLELSKNLVDQSVLASG